MRHLRLTVAYDGTHYVGWQVQPNGVSIQQRMEEAWASVTGETIRIVASGRTDSGVHALGQVCSLATDTSLSCPAILRALNATTPEDISVTEVQPAPRGFHAIRDASRKTYRYRIQFGGIRNPIGAAYCWFCPGQVDVEAMRLAATFLVGEHDFASFEATGSQRDSTIRNLSRLDCDPFQQHDFEYLDITMTCSGFLYNMVRIIVGTLIRAGQGSQSPEWVAWVRDQYDRSVAGPTAPAHALTLLRVEYDGITFLADL